MCSKTIHHRNIRLFCWFNLVSEAYALYYASGYLQLNNAEQHKTLTAQSELVWPSDQKLSRFCLKK